MAITQMTCFKTICNKIVRADNYRCMQLLQKQLDKDEMSPDEIKELDRLTKANDFMIKLFNQIVSHGKELAIEFINNNYQTVRLC